MNPVLPSVALFNLASIGVALVGTGIMLAFDTGSRKLVGAFFSTLLLFVMLPVDDLALSLVNHTVTTRYDQYVYCVDQILGSPSFAMGRLFLRWPWFQSVALYVYVLVPTICLAVALLRYALLSIPEGTQTVRTVFICCLLAYPIYSVFPVAGPRYAFPSFPLGAPDHLIPHVMHLHAVPNGVPSVHMALAILVFWFSRTWWLGKVFASIFVLLTVAATLGSGEHYLFDLLVAIPYAILVLYLGSSSPVTLTEQSTEKLQQVEAGAR